MNSISAIQICPYNLRSFAKNDTKLQVEKLEAAKRYHNILGILDTHLNQDEVNVMIKNFYDPSLILSQTQGIMGKCARLI